MPPSPPAEKTTAGDNQTGQSSTGDGTGNAAQVDEINPLVDGRVGVTEVNVTERTVADDIVAMCQRERTGDVEPIRNLIGAAALSAEDQQADYSARVDAVSLIE